MPCLDNFGMILLLRLYWLSFPFESFAAQGLTVYQKLNENDVLSGSLNIDRLTLFVSMLRIWGDAEESLSADDGLMEACNFSDGLQK